METSFLFRFLFTSNHPRIFYSPFLSSFSLSCLEKISYFIHVYYNFAFYVIPLHNIISGYIMFYHLCYTISGRLKICVDFSFTTSSGSSSLSLSIQQVV